MACNYKAYEQGDGPYSYLQTEVGTISIKEPFTISEALLDNGQTILFSPTIKRTWAGRTDTIYRAIISYTPNAKGAEVQQIEPMTALTPILRTNQDGKSNPLYVQSVWLAQNKEYINVRLGIKTGIRTNKDQQHELYLLETNKKENKNSTKRYEWTLVYKRNNIPEIITTNLFATINIKDKNKGDTIVFKAQDYKETKTYIFVK